MSFRIDLEKTLEYAEGLFIQIKNFKNLPSNICEIFGFPVVEKNKDEIDVFEDSLINKSRDEANRVSSIKSSQQNSDEEPKSSESNRSSTISKSPAPANNNSIPKNKSYTFKKDEDSIELLN